LLSVRFHSLTFIFSGDENKTSVIPVEIETLCSRIEEICSEKIDQITANIYKGKF
jgi:hypothetical protein